MSFYTSFLLLTPTVSPQTWVHPGAWNVQDRLINLTSEGAQLRLVNKAGVI